MIRPLRHSIWRSLRHDLHVTCLVLTSLIVICVSTLAACCQQPTTVTTASDPAYFVPRDRFVQSAPNVAYRDVTPQTVSGGCRRVYVFTGSAFILVLYLVYLVECCYNRHRQLLSTCSKRRCLDPRTAYLLINSLRHAHPLITWSAVSFHYIRRSDHVTRLRHYGGGYSGGGQMVTNSAYAQWQRVVTRRATSGFDSAAVGGVCDASPRLIGLELFPVTCVRFLRQFSFATSRARRHFTAQRSAFFDCCESRDDNVDFRQTFDLLSATSDYFRSRVVIVRDPDACPWYMCRSVYWTASALLLSIPGPLHPPLSVP